MVTWQQFKDQYSLAGISLIRQLLATCSKELRRELSKQTGATHFKLTEEQLLDHIKQLALPRRKPAMKCNNKIHLDTSELRIIKVESLYEEKLNEMKTITKAMAVHALSSLDLGNTYNRDQTEEEPRDGQTIPKIKIFRDPEDKVWKFLPKTFNQDDFEQEKREPENDLEENLEEEEKREVEAKVKASLQPFSQCGLQCDYYYTSRSQLYSHYSTRHFWRELEPLVNSLECSYCGVKFSNTASHISHLGSVHNFVEKFLLPELQVPRYGEKNKRFPKK